MERRYPVYRFTIWWEITNPMTKYDDRAMESTSWYHQYPEPPEPDFFENQIRKLWIAFVKADRFGGQPSLADRGAVLIGYEVEMVEIETWYQILFQHASLNTHLSDEELLESFRHFVARKWQAHLNTYHYDDFTPEEREGKEFYCLMGAEDGWRWRGPCRCEHCQEQGVVRIDH